ncbi:MAG: hypothetical protein IKK92_06695, partial [Prevotella sp.]|nr:hypothetical protein [Prevotella sp.]
EEYADTSVLLPKEEKLVELINQEISENRNVFIYASYTGDVETNVTERYKTIVEKYCNLKGRVQIIQASSPSPIKREAWIQKKASEGIRCFICNPKVVETGLDFCFNYNGAFYNYPTLIFTQISYEMSVIWQASRRHYRLNQKEECRTYYLAYENTLQTAALEIMAAKQVATSAIQGKFSSEGLAAMAKGVDTRTQLAAALAKNDMSDRKGLESMFDALNAQNNAADDTYADYVPPKTFYELLNITEELNVFESDGNFQMTDLFSLDFEADYSAREALGHGIQTVIETSTSTIDSHIHIDLFGDLFAQIEAIDSDRQSLFTVGVSINVPDAPKKPKKTKKLVEGQCSLFDDDIFGVA